MTEMFDLTDALELISDGLDDSSFAQQHFVRQGEQAIVHLFTEFGDELKPLCHQKLSGKRLRKIAFVTKEFAEEGSRSIQKSTWLMSKLSDVRKGVSTI